MESPFGGDDFGSFGKPQCGAHSAGRVRLGDRQKRAGVLERLSRAAGCALNLIDEECEEIALIE
jgi:hypothetical protein